MIGNRILQLVVLLCCLFSFTLSNSAEICQDCGSSVSYKEGFDYGWSNELIVFASQSSETTIHLGRSQTRKRSSGMGYAYSLVLLSKSTRPTTWKLVLDPKIADQAQLLKIYVYPAGTIIRYTNFGKTPSIVSIPADTYSITPFSTKFDKQPDKLWSFLKSSSGQDYTFFSGCDDANQFATRNSDFDKCGWEVDFDPTYFLRILGNIVRFIAVFVGLLVLCCCCCCCCCCFCGVCFVVCAAISVFYTGFSLLRTLCCCFCCCCGGSKKKKYYNLDQQQPNHQMTMPNFKDMKYRKIVEPITPGNPNMYQQQPQMAAPALPAQQDMAPLLNHNSTTLNYSQYSYPTPNPQSVYQPQPQPPQMNGVYQAQSSISPVSPQLEYQGTHFYQPPQQYNQPQYGSEYQNAFSQNQMNASSSSSALNQGVDLIDKNAEIQNNVSNNSIYPNPYSINLEDNGAEKNDAVTPYDGMM